MSREKITLTLFACQEGSGPRDYVCAYRGRFWDHPLSEFAFHNSPEGVARDAMIMAHPSEGQVVTIRTLARPRRFYNGEGYDIGRPVSDDEAMRFLERFAREYAQIQKKAG